MLKIKSIISCVLKMTVSMEKPMAAASPRSGFNSKVRMKVTTQINWRNRKRVMMMVMMMMMMTCRDIHELLHHAMEVDKDDGGQHCLQRESSVFELGHDDVDSSSCGVASDQRLRQVAHNEPKLDQSKQNLLFIALISLTLRELHDAHADSRDQATDLIEDGLDVLALMWMPIQKYKGRQMERCLLEVLKVK
ncbi:hypothetical protein EYF80_025072 [Liparis tanakae]|uniref:Uncharacterized protein n=1 Tax=Liparis tanakae TaxID=230148 RepID=A0A4Z2HHC1_9TELE|nr:hypothetical protein EYF80_025072 [Liparis tanakae]